MTSKLDPQELERLAHDLEVDAVQHFEPAVNALTAIADKLRTGQLVPAMPSGNEVAWLIERDDLRTAESGDRVCLHYYAESRPGRHYWTPDHLKAKRFPTCESAMVECNNDPLLRVCEHMWMGSQPSEKHAEMVNHLRQLARKQEGYGMSFSDPSPRGGGTASINLYGDRAKAAIWLFKNADRIADALTARAALGEKP